MTDRVLFCVCLCLFVFWLRKPVGGEVGELDASSFSFLFSFLIRSSLLSTSILVLHT
jgi:hypothetical protein